MIFVMLVSLLFGYVYEDSDSLIVNNDSLTVCGNHIYNIKVQIVNHGKLKVKPWKWNWPTDSIGWLCLNAPLIAIQDSSSIMGSECGYEGGSMSNHPYGYGPGYGSTGGLSGGGGGGAGYGGDGGHGGDYYGGDGGSAYGCASDTLIHIGSGGGAGRLVLMDGSGGDGGAMIYLRAQKVIIESSSIETNGQRGYDGSVEAGAGGSGGGIMLITDSTVVHNATMNSNGGGGGEGYGGGGGGGAGGGRIKMFYSSYLDTSEIILSVRGGAAGISSYVDPDSGMPGSIYIGPIIGISEIASTPAVRFMVQSTLVRNRVKITVEDPPLQLMLYDVSGRIAKIFWIKNSTEYICLSELRRGIYFLKSSDNNKYIGKIILLK